MRGVFVTGTDTGVGKTAVACAIAAWCRQHAMDVGVMKPVATGGLRLTVDGARRWVSEDALQLAQAAQVTDALTLINPVCFQAPLAPLVAAQRGRTSIRLHEIVSAFHRLCARHEYLIVEGIGGLLVPLTTTHTVADLIARLRLPILIVGRSRLGTLNHILLTLRTAEQMGLRVRGILLNTMELSPGDRMARLVEATNASTLAQYTEVPILGPLPFHRILSDGQASGSSTVRARWIERAIGARMLRCMFEKP